MKLLDNIIKSFKKKFGPPALNIEESLIIDTIQHLLKSDSTKTIIANLIEHSIIEGYLWNSQLDTTIIIDSPHIYIQTGANYFEHYCDEFFTGKIVDVIRDTVRITVGNAEAKVLSTKKSLLSDIITAASAGK